MTEETVEPTLELEPTFEKQETIYATPASEIFTRDDRHRQLFKRKPLEELIDSIREIGQTGPGVCHWNEEGKLELLIGERRLRACLLLQTPFKYYIKEEVKDPLLLEQIQLDENLCREDLEWKEDLKAKKRLHELFQSRFGKTQPGVMGGHSIDDTATHMGVGKSILQEDITLAGFLDIPEVAAAPNKTTAKKIVKRMIEQVQRRELLDKALSATKKLTEQAPLTEEARAEAKLAEREREEKWREKAKKAGEEIKTQEELAAFIDKQQAKTKSEAEIRLEKQLIYFNSRCFLAKMETKLLDFSDESFDIVCFDPPWGVEFDSVKRESAGTKTYEDSQKNFQQELRKWLELIFKKMKSDSHLYMFFGIVHHQFIYDVLEFIGFKTNRIPLIWHKQGAHVTRNPTIWPGRSYEPIAYARKGSKPLVKQGAPDVIPTPAPTPSLKDIHPSAKHPQIYKELLLRSAQPSDTILDPMAGSGMFAVAAESLSQTLALNWFQIEIDEDYRNLQLLNLTKGYEELAKKEIETEREVFQHQDWEPEPLPKTFELIKPGTDEWTRYWSEHPEEQGAMLTWRREQKGGVK
jgi:ParB-like chromosome segregation protein Spo0J